MSDETKEEGCGTDPRAGWSAEDLFCGGPLVFDERIAADIKIGITDLEQRDLVLKPIQFEVPGDLDLLCLIEEYARKLVEMTVIPGHLLGVGPRLSDGVALGSAEHPAGDPVPEDADIPADAVKTIEIDLEDQGERLADLLALVRPPDISFDGVLVRQDTWNLGDDHRIVALVSGSKIGLLLAHYGTEDYAEILKRFSDPEFRAAHNLDKTPDFSAVTRDIARS